RRRPAVPRARRGPRERSAEEGDVISGLVIRVRDVVAIVAIVAASASAQPGARRATNIAALQAFPGFYHGRPVLIVGTVAVDKDQIRVSDEAGSIRLISKGSAPDGLDEIRGEF